MFKNRTDLLTAEEVARILRISEDSVRRLGKRGQLPEVRVGERLVRYKSADLAKIIGK